MKTFNIVKRWFLLFGEKLNIYTIRVLGPITNYWIMKWIFSDVLKICFPQIFLSIESDHISRIAA